MVYFGFFPISDLYLKVLCYKFERNRNAPMTNILMRSSLAASASVTVLC